MALKVDSRNVHPPRLLNEYVHPPRLLNEYIIEKSSPQGASHPPCHAVLTLH